MKKIILFLLIVLMAKNTWASYPNYTVCASGCDFTTFSLAIADIQTNHPTLNAPTTITATDSSTETARITISGITTSVTNTLTLTTSGSGANGGKMPSGGSGGYLIKPSSNNAITITANNVIIKGLAIDESSVSSANAVSISNYYTGISFIGNVIKGNTSGGQGLNFGAPRGNNYIINNVMYGFENGSPVSLNGTSDSGTYVYIYNNTVYDNYYGFNLNDGGVGGHIYFSNNIDSGKITASIFDGTYITSGTKNICSDSSSCTASPLTNGTNNATSYSNYYTSYTTRDFSLKAGSILIRAGTDLSGTFTTDIAGNARTGWDVGAFYFQNITDIKGATIKGATIR